MAGLFLHFKETGDAKVDMQHAHLLAIISELESAIRSGEPRGDKLAIMSELMYYASTHFLDEERLMERIEFPQLDRQRKLHAEFGATLSSEISRFVEDRGNDGSDILALTRTWFIEHVELEDAKIAEYVESSRARAAS